MTHLARVCSSLVLAACVAAPLAAQREEQTLNYQWYWGAQAGGMAYATAAQPTYWDPIVGAHWFITAKRVGLYAALDQAFLTVDAVTVVNGRVVRFGEVRRIMVGLIGMPLRQALEPYIGGGFALTYIVDPRIDCSGCSSAEQSTVSNAVNRQSGAAFAWVMAGGQYNVGKLSVFGHYVLTDAAGFLIQGATHTLQGGIRYSFGRSREGLPPGN